MKMRGARAQKGEICAPKAAENLPHWIGAEGASNILDLVWEDVDHLWGC
jgi:hypothetical protein